MRRIRRALRTNEPQVASVAMFSSLTVLAVLLRGDAPLWAYIVAGGFWPVLAFVLNLIDPMPSDKEDGKA